MIFDAKKGTDKGDELEILSILIDKYESEKFSICFYGWNIKEKFEEFKKEEGMFIFSTLGSEKIFHSSKFDGDNIEERLTYLEDDEIANWGSNEFYLFDRETIL